MLKQHHLDYLSRIYKLEEIVILMNKEIAEHDHAFRKQQYRIKVKQIKSEIGVLSKDINPEFKKYILLLKSGDRFKFNDVISDYVYMKDVMVCFMRMKNI
jgi:hypothetical protein